MTTLGPLAALVVRKGRPFSRVEFDRREVADVLGVRLALATAEVTRDLDWAYLRHWASELGVADLLHRAGSEAGR